MSIEESQEEVNEMVQGLKLPAGGEDLLNGCCAPRLTVKAYLDARGHSGVGHPVSYG